MQQAENPLAVGDGDRLTTARGTQARGGAPVRREAALGRCEQHEHDRGGSRTHVLLVLHELAGESRGPDDERGCAVELRSLDGACALLEQPKAVGPEHAEAPRLREVVVRREAREVEKLQQRLAWNGLRAEGLVRPPACSEVGEAHARRAETCTSAPPRSSSWENGHPASAFATASLRPASSSPSAATAKSTCDATIWWPWPSTSSITIRQVTSSRPVGVPAFDSSPDSDIAMQPPCAAASSSSGLVLPSGRPIRDGSEKPSSLNAPEPPVSVPFPRAAFPS